MKKLFKKLIIIFIIIILILMSCLVYFEIYYHAEDICSNYLESSEDVKIKKTKNYIFFDGKGENSAIIFYPGAKVQTESYSRLMYKLAENDIDCFLLNLPFRFAFFGKNYPNEILENYSYDNWYLSGHSLGGVVATSYLEDNEKISGIIYLASYPNNELKGNLKVISIYGENDKVLNMNSYNNAKWTEDYNEYVISGGNHSGFANYGIQKGDGENTIGNEEQQDKVVEIITEEILP